MLAFSAVGKTEARVVRRRMSRPDSGFATTPTIASPMATHLLALCCAPEGKTGTAIVVRILWPGPCPLSRVTASLRSAGPPRVTPGSFMAKIRARGYLVAGVDPGTYHFGFFNPSHGQFGGFDIDMLDAIAKAIFGDPNKIEFKAITDAQRISAVRSGSVDIV